ncbi:ROK family transcriptional regulator [Bifidobacterium choloepi]|uniref:ROK family protein n=1 Tax=Bifidobacterium choloepi TaxID=2614131 RepID=A0A6I5NMN6_9BIFI|nr:ROK family protein [Bifidobacterium choloepi]NEG70002.1 ROK family protein [Bifidobacterium choloepi]
MAGRIFGSQRSLREANRANLLETVHKFGAMTQVELAELTGLSTATVSALVHELVDDGKIETRNTVRNGRRATLVTLARNQGLGVGIMINRRELELQILDFSKQSLANHKLPLADGHQPDETLDRAQVLLSEAIDAIGADFSEIVGIGVALGAPIERRDFTVAVPGIMTNWDGFDVKGQLEDAYRMPVYIDNDANAGALCEARIGAAAEQGVRSFLYVRAGNGVGGAIVINGEVWHGVTGLAGEIGHVQIDPLGAICLCGNRGCLDTVVNEERLTSLLSVTYGNLTLEDMVRRANEGDPGCRRVISDAAVRVGDVAASTCIAFDPEMVVVGGTLSLAGETFLEPFRESLERKLFPDVVAAIDVLPAKYPVENPAIGAAIMAIENAERADLG